MLNSPNIPMYGHKASVLNYTYAAKHGYAFVVERCPRKEDMGDSWMWVESDQYVLVWSKGPLIMRHLHNYDYVMFIDSDAVVVDTNFTVEDFISRHFTENETCIVGAQDCQSDALCYDKEAMNTGVMVFKNSPKTFEILSEWIDAPKTELCAKWKFNHPREQACLNEIIKTQKHAKHIKLIDFKEMNSVDGKWVKHYMGTDRSYREEVIGSAMHKTLDQFINNVERFYANADTRGSRTHEAICIMITLIVFIGILFALSYMLGKRREVA